MFALSLSLSILTTTQIGSMGSEFSAAAEIRSYPQSRKDSVAINHFVLYCIFGPFFVLLLRLSRPLDMIARIFQHYLSSDNRKPNTDVSKWPQKKSFNLIKGKGPRFISTITELQFRFHLTQQCDSFFLKNPI